MSKVPETFIEAHMALCHREGGHRRAYTPDSKYYGRRQFKYTTPRNRKRECAKKLYNDCLKLGIEPTPIRADFIREYDRIKGIA